MYDIQKILHDWCDRDVYRDTDDLRENFTALCPFHADTHPSFSMHRDGRFYCYTCHEKGNDIFQFTARRFQLSEVRWYSILTLLYPYLLSNSDMEGSTPPALVQRKQILTSARTTSNLVAAIDYAHGNFHGDPLISVDWNHLDSPAKVYMGSRGFLSATLERGHVAVWERFHDHPLFFPCMFNTTVYGYIQKAIEKKVFPRFLTMPGMIKSDHVYGYAPAHTSVGIVVEGFTDQLMALQYGWHEEKFCSFAILGSSVSSAQAQEMATHCALLYSCFDNDSAGEAAHQSLLREMAPYNIPIIRVRFPQKDIGLCTVLEFWQALVQSGEQTLRCLSRTLRK